MTGVFRFAPSPNGRLHLGHARSALINHDMAARAGGRFLLRIEDIDVTRCRPEFEVGIYEDLAWLGLAWETPVRRQSEHFADFRAALEALEAAGLLFASFESRAELAALSYASADGGRDPDGAPLYRGLGKTLTEAERRRRIAAGAPHALRLDMARALARLEGPLTYVETGHGREETRIATPERWGDVVLARKETPTSYHLSVVVDDALQGITDVVRGRDLEAATSVHRLLQALLGLRTPRYHHHALILDAQGNKLAKSAGAEPIAALRRRGVAPAEVRAMAGLEPAI